MNQSYQSQQQISSSSSANPKAAKLVADYKQIILELRAQNFDVVRFATYRTASKLRFIQKKLNLHLIDLWNVIETFRDNNLHTLDIVSELDTSRIEACVQNMYLQLNKRLAYNQHINVESQTQLMMAWLLNLFDKSRLVKCRVLSLKVALTTMCAGKLVDKLKYIFTQISDQSKNVLVPIKFEMYLKDLLTLPKSVFEEPSFGYTENTSRTCFDTGQPVRLDDFLNVALSDAGPPCFIWLNIFHRFTIVQNITHPVTCSACERSHFNGFRYKCQKCRKYQLCQDCFWRGRATHSHQLTHQMKEYTCYKSAAKQFSNSLRRSFFCKPNKSSQLQQQSATTNTNNNATTSNKYSTMTTSNTTMNSHHHHQTGAFVSGNNKFSSLDNDYPSPSRTNAALPSAANPSAQTQNYNSDYSILMASSGSPGHMNHHQQLVSMNSCNLPPVLSMDGKPQQQQQQQLSPTSIIKPKKVVHPSQQSNVEETYLSSDSIRLTDHTFDMKHIVPSSDTIKPTPSVTIVVQPSNNTNNSNKQQQSNNSNQSHNNNNNNLSSSLSMTRSQNDNMNTSSNLYLSYLLSNSPSTTINNNNNNEEEHALIAGYCSRLSNFYAKNPHLATTDSPTTPSPSHHTNNNNHHSSPLSQSNSAYATLNSHGGNTTPLHHKTSLNSSHHHHQASKPSNLKQSTSRRSYNNIDDEEDDDDEDEENDILRHHQSVSSAASSRTASLQRHLWTQSSRSSNKLSQYNTLNPSTTTNNNNKSLNYDTSNLLSGISSKHRGVVVNGKATPTKKKVVLTGLLDDESSSDCPTQAQATTKNERGRSMSDFRLNGYKHDHREEVTTRGAAAMSPPDAVNKSIEERILKEKKEIVAKLERQNREIAKEIKRLKLKQKMTTNTAGVTPSSTSSHNLKPVYMEGGPSSSHRSTTQQVKKSLLQSDRSEDLDSPKIAGATIIDPLIISLNEQQTQKKGYNKLKTSTLLNQPTLQQNSSIIAELQNLKNRKGQLETRMHTLLSSKDELQSQLKTLLRTSTTSTSSNKQNTQAMSSNNNSLLSSPRSLTLNSTQKYNSLINPYQIDATSSSPINAVPGLTDLYNSKTTLSASLAMQMPPTTTINPHQARQMTSSSSSGQHHRSWSTPSTPALFELHPTRLSNKTPAATTTTTTNGTATKLNGVAGMAAGSTSLAPSTQSSMLSLNALSHFGPNNFYYNHDQSSTSSIAGGGGGGGSNTGSTANLRSLRNDLLIAADSVTNAMQSLVKELHSENEENFVNTSDDDDDDQMMNELKAKGSLSSSRHQSYHNHLPPPPLYPTSLSANATPLIYRKGFPGGSESLQQQQYHQTQFSLSSSQLANEFSDINNNNNNSDLMSNSNTLSKVNLIKQLAQTFKDMNVNSEYDDVVNQLENELLTCRDDHDHEQQQTQQISNGGGVGQNHSHHRKAVLIENMVLETNQQNNKPIINNEEEMENMIYEKFLVSKSYLDENGQGQLEGGDHENRDETRESMIEQNHRERSQSEASHTERIITNILNSSQQQQITRNNDAGGGGGGGNNEQIASWRRELEQILVDVSVVNDDDDDEKQREEESNNQIELELNDEVNHHHHHHQSMNEGRQQDANNNQIITSGATTHRNQDQNVDDDDSDEFSLL